MRKAILLIATLAAFGAGAAPAVTEPPPETELVSCQQYNFEDGDCWMICTFRSASGDPQGYIISKSC